MSFGGGKAQHHNCVARCSHQVVTFLHDFPILAVIEPEFFPPIIQVLEHFEPTRLHSSQHVHQAGLNTDRLLAGALKVMREFVKHVETLRLVLLRQGNAGAFQSLAVAVPRPGPRQFLPQALSVAA